MAPAFEKKRQLSVIVVNFNGGKLLSECLTSMLVSKIERRVKLFVVDNASTDGSPETVERDFPQVELIRNDRNAGFAVANNQALSKVASDYVSLVNPDVILPPDGLARLVGFLEEHPMAAIVGPKQINQEGKYNPASKMGRVNVLNTVSKSLGVSRVFPKSRVFASYYLGHIDKDVTSTVDAVSGACMVARTDALRRVGFFDERFPLGCEDLDLCYRVAAIGLIYYCPEVTVIHAARQSRKRHPELSIMRFTQGAKLLYQKYEAPLHPEWYNEAVLRGLDLSAVARIAFTRLLSRTKTTK